jgi:DNA-binding SARP family transcriptional activator
MSPFKICLLGKFSVQRGGEEIGAFPSAKARELFCYLLLHRDRSHSREILTNLLWGDHATSQAKKYFRQTLWQLQLALHGHPPCDSSRLVCVSDDSLRLDSQPELWLDTAVFEQACESVQGISGEQITDAQAKALQEAIALYKGDLVEGNYQDWCLYHRERLQNLYLAMLDKLMACCEAHCKFEAGVTYGELLLQQDPARERTYCRLIRLHYLAGDRAGAIRQFQRCTAALQKELGVSPARKTVELYNQVCSDKFAPEVSSRTEGRGHSREDASSANSSLPVQSRLEAIRSLLLRVQHRLDREIREVNRVLSLTSSGTRRR